MNRIQDLFFKNTWLKVISLLTAILLWMICMNINNPEMTQSYSVPLSLKNLSHVTDSGMIVLNEEEISKTQVYIKIKATRNDLLSLDETRLEAYIDFSPVDITNSKNIGKSVPVSIQIQVPNSSYEIIDYSPRIVSVSFDELVTRDFQVEVNQIGETNKKYEITDSVTVTPEFVTIKGPKSYVDTIHKVSVDVDVSGATETIDEQYQINVYDDDENLIVNKFTLSSQSASVKIPIKMIESILIATPKYEGEPAANYQVVDVTWSPKYVDVIGSDDIINNLSYIELPPVNVTGATTDISQTFDLNLILEDLGLKVRSASQSECTVTFTVEEVITKIASVDSENITFLNRPNNVEIPDNFYVTVTGPTSEIAKIDTKSITGVCDLKDIPEGETDVIVDVFCPNEFIKVETPVRLRVNNILD